MKVIIFGGTYEGRELAEWAAQNGISVILCVATDYGEDLCTPARDLAIKKGRMDSEEMSHLFEEEDPQVIVDATHPHAATVSANIRKAADDHGLSLLRVIRPESAALPDGYSDWEKNFVSYVSSVSEAMEYLALDNEPILLTTGSKELPSFSSLPSFAERIYARVLPESNALEACHRAGLTGRHIIAMQGPFSVELNMALIASTGAKWLVTKESGESGGFPEKMEAAARSHIRAIVIQRPCDEEGLSLEETKKELLKRKGKGCRDITLIGMGMGGGSQLTLEALEALNSSSVIFGAKRMIRDIDPYVHSKPLIPLYKGGEIISFLDEHPEYGSACVVFSGDTGFYSGCADFLSGVKEEKVRILPGISAFSCLCARFGLREEEFMTASAHGRGIDAVELLLTFRKIFLLLDDKTTIGSVCKALEKAGLGDTLVYGGIDLGYPGEELLKGYAKDFTDRDGDALAVIAMEMEGRDLA